MSDNPYDDADDIPEDDPVQAEPYKTYETHAPQANRDCVDVPDMPHDPVAERAVLASVLLNGAQVWNDVAGLDPADFYVPANRLIFRTILELHSEGAGYDDLICVRNRLIEKGQMDSISETHLIGLTQGHAKSVSAEHYVQIVSWSAASRNIALKAERIKKLALTGNDRSALAEMIKSTESILATTGKKEGNVINVGGIYNTPLVEPPWAISGWMCHGESVLLGGEWGVGKSIVCLDLALALATDLKYDPSWAGLRVCPNADVPGPQRVLYLDEENSLHQIKSRLTRMLSGRGIHEGSDRLKELDKNFRYMTMNGFDLSKAEPLGRFRSEVSDFNPQWVVIDSLIRFHSMDENSNMDMKSWYDSVVQTAMNNWKCGFIVIHHMRKPGTKADPTVRAGHRIRGASDLPGAFNEVWSLGNEESDPTLRTEKGRWGNDGLEVKVLIEDAEEGRSLIVRGESPQKQTDDCAYNNISRAGTTGILKKDILYAVVARTGDTNEVAGKHLSSCLSRYVATGKVKRLREGNSSRYWLTNLAPEGAE